MRRARLVVRSRAGADESLTLGARLRLIVTGALELPDRLADQMKQQVVTTGCHAFDLVFDLIRLNWIATQRAKLPGAVTAPHP